MSLEKTKEEKMWTQGRRGGGHVKTEAETGVIWPQTKEHPDPLAAGSGKEGFFSRSFRRSTDLLIAALQTSALQTSVCDLSFCLKSLYFDSVNKCCLSNSNSSFDLQLTLRCFRRPLSHLRQKCLISVLNYMEFLKI